MCLETLLVIHRNRSHERLIGSQTRLVQFFGIYSLHTDEIGRRRILFFPLGEYFIRIPSFVLYVESISQTFPHQRVDLLSKCETIRDRDKLIQISESHVRTSRSEHSILRIRNKFSLVNSSLVGPPLRERTKSFSPTAPRTEYIGSAAGGNGNRMSGFISSLGACSSPAAAWIRGNVGRVESRTAELGLGINASTSLRLEMNRTINMITLFNSQ